MSFQFSPETFIREIDFQIEELQAEINNLTVPLNQLLDIGPPEKVVAIFESSGVIFRGGIARTQTNFINSREVDASVAAINSFNTQVSILTSQITALETQISDLTRQRGAFQNEIDIRITIPTDISVPPSVPTLMIPIQEQGKIGFKQIVVLIALGLLIL